MFTLCHSKNYPFGEGVLIAGISVGPVRSNFRIRVSAKYSVHWIPGY